MQTNILLLFIFIFCTITVTYAQPSKQVEGDAAFLFGYYPKEGMQVEFEEGYKKHLEWHRIKNDPLPWYGWYVITGDRIGMFVDGTFGISFESFDNRVLPAEDMKHFQQYVAPYSDASYRKVFKLEPDLSTTRLLEDWNPSFNIEAYSFSIMPGREPLFEKTLQKIVALLESREDHNGFTIYRRLTGGSMPSYLMMVPHSGFAYYDSTSPITTLSHLIEHSFEKAEAENLLKNLSNSIDKIHGETWFYQKDLSYFPE